MSDEAAKPTEVKTEATPVATTAVADKPATPAAPAEPVFNTDILRSCTTRLTRKAWNLFLEYTEDINKIRTVPIRATLEAASLNDAEALHRLLLEDGVKEISRKDKVISMTTTFEVIQKVIKLPASKMLDAVKI